MGFKGILSDYLLCLFAITMEPLNENYPYFEEECIVTDDDLYLSQSCLSESDDEIII